VTTAHRGQNRRSDPQLTTPGVGRADVWVFDATAPGDALGGDPLTVLVLFADSPRALAVSPDGATVYAAAFRSGNQTVTIPEGAVCDGGQDASCEVDGLPMPGGLPAPNVNADGVSQPEVGLIVRFDPATGAWSDAIGRDWRNAVRLSLPDTDVFAIDALATPPAATAAFAQIGTVIYGLAVNPASGALYASNTEARNEVRFAGAGVLGGSSVRGHLHESRVTVIDAQGVRPRHLNPHIDYATVPSPPGVKERSLALPGAMAVTGDGATVYLAAFGSAKIAVLAAAAVEAGGAQLAAALGGATHLGVPGGGPSGIVLDEPGGRLYVMARFANAIDVLDMASGALLQQVSLHDAEPPAVKVGRPLLYDATLGSSNGEASCAACHVFADVDDLAWDLGDPDAPVLPNPNPARSPDLTSAPDFHPMKGPLTTQTLRGLATHGAMHWRGDRTGGYQPGVDPRDERAAFLEFNAAFADLLGREGPLPAAQMAALADFALAIAEPPNPVRALDGTLSPIQQLGREMFAGCRECHVTDPTQGFFGTDGFVAMTGTNPTQFMKIPHLENFYTKVGIFVMPPPFNAGDTTFIGDQVRGFGFTHDGSVGFYNGNPEIEQYLLAFETRLAPVVGQQVTLDALGSTEHAARVDLLIARAAAGDCDLAVKGVFDGVARGWLRSDDGSFRSDRAGEPLLSDDALRAQAGVPGGERTYTCVPPGSGVRIAIDRDLDGALDRDEIDAGADPQDAGSVPFACVGGGLIAPARLRIARSAAGIETITMRGELTLAGPVDPAGAGFLLGVSDAGGPRLSARTLPGSTGWRADRGATRWVFRDGSATAAGGITRIVLRDRSRRRPGLFTFRIEVRRSLAAVSPLSPPAQFAIGIGTPGTSACATSGFALASCRAGTAGLVCS
jgi:DNA-binding beta-propeller fold protein YncE